MDAGQPDSAGDPRSSLRNLVAAQDKLNARMGYQMDYANVGKGANANQANQGLDKGVSDLKRSQKRPNINVTTNPLDISLINAQQPRNTQGCNAQGSGSVKSRGRSAGEFHLYLSICSSRSRGEKRVRHSVRSRFRT